MGSLFEIHRSNLEWLKSYVYPDGFKLDSDICDYFRKPVYRRSAHV